MFLDLMSCELLVVFFLFPWSSLNEDEQVRLLLSNKVWSRWPQPKFVWSRWPQPKYIVKWTQFTVLQCNPQLSFHTTIYNIFHDAEGEGFVVVCSKIAGVKGWLSLISLASCSYLLANQCYFPFLLTKRANSAWFQKSAKVHGSLLAWSVGMVNDFADL